jgi:hypothetical protein
LVDALIVPVTGESLLHLFPIEHARCRVDAAVNARPTLRHPASQIRLLHFVTPCDWRQATIESSRRPHRGAGLSFCCLVPIDIIDRRSVVAPRLSEQLVCHCECVDVGFLPKHSRSTCPKRY